MELLLDTHLLLWASAAVGRLSASTVALLDDESNDLFFSVASIWEVSINRGQNRFDFQIDPGVLRKALLKSGYRELSVDGRHAVAVAGLPLIHKDPFDRMLVAQAMVEGILLLTADAVVAQYPGPIRLV